MPVPDHGVSARIEWDGVHELADCGHAQLLKAAQCVFERSGSLQLKYRSVLLGFLSEHNVDGATLSAWHRLEFRAAVVSWNDGNVRVTAAALKMLKLLKDFDFDKMAHSVNALYTFYLLFVGR